MKLVLYKTYNLMDMESHLRHEGMSKDAALEKIRWMKDEGLIIDFDDQTKEV